MRLGDSGGAKLGLKRVQLGAAAHLSFDQLELSEAVEASLNEPFDLILMDLQMPGMDGMDATEAIRETSSLNQSTPILATT